MKNILILGAGKSSTALISYMLSKAEENDWLITVGDISKEAAEAKINNHPKGAATYFSADDDVIRNHSIREADIVLSLLPHNLHAIVAADCVRYRRHFVCASYVSEEMKALHTSAENAGVLLLNECGLDPGLDHMSAMRIIHEIQNNGGVITAFESYAGGLIAPESDDNPWHYKFTWNPRNVVLAGQGVAKFIWGNKVKYVPYNKLFERYDELQVDGYGIFEGYPNRDSLKYVDTYQLKNLHTMVRGTLRTKGFCDAWNVFVQLGITDNSYQIDGLKDLTWVEFIKLYIPHDASLSIPEKLAQYLKITDRPDILEKLEWLGLFSNEPIGMESGTPADVLLKLLEKNWKLKDGDKDMCVMKHLIEYTNAGKKYLVHSNMVAIGEDEKITAMAKTVGLPMGIAATLILQGKISEVGVVIPVKPEIYNPILDILADEHNIAFQESTETIV
ncbi:MAG: saccharopine dehydrogenase NADP-binding domain-containing protein [Chitinophagales bacterium]|nr:saccharopine dehydrogenase NADP-binding domain-containing protein [Chitinophagales bacterium]MBP8893719.1 saccharopine dehydrogenase NADP-binding domain-containing protein [Saprospiraceae bacterium]MBP9189607.1 saccharopine dehydrogenase NADP-binding domain-containing protein [Chitinophagales bacterium]MBP9549051.1 saccharopine dehydrogenase NADP-binding domain-containing protein [Chitinophagales bacterium]MBP9705232.1 saccharopine dehydrogenase NADP-binding domain-containing protein [Chitin